jgi:glycosyltransferase involved in cell wall biosynthesis
MTWNFKKEIECQSKGLIDFHLYQSDHGLDMVSKGLAKFNDYKPLRFDPYFDMSEFPYSGVRLDDKFRFGRISRSDRAKYNIDQFNIYDSFESPVNKSGIVLGWDDKMLGKVGLNKSHLSVDCMNKYYKNYIQLLKVNSVPQQDFYKFCDVMILAADTFENLPRVGFEAMSSGSVMIVNDRGGWKLQVDDGVTGFLCETTKDFIEKSTLLANNVQMKEDMRGGALLKLKNEWGLEQSMKSWELIFKEWEKK